MARAAKSPYDLARFINAHPAFQNRDPLWKSLGIDPEKLSLEDCGFWQQCSTELITVFDPFQVIVLIRAAGGDLGEVYLRYRGPSGPEAPGPWTFAGFYSNGSRTYDTRHEVIRFGSKPFLVVTANEHYGSIPDAAVQRWFDLTGPRFEPVLRLRLKGESDSFPLDHVIVSSSAMILKLEPEPVERITVIDHLTFEIPVLGADALGSVEAEVTYAPRNGIFEVETAKPFLPNDQALFPLFEIWRNTRNVASDDALHFLLSKLKAIASGTNTEQRDWLKDFLAGCKDSPEKREVEELLSKARAGATPAPRR